MNESGVKMTSATTYQHRNRLFKLDDTSKGIIGIIVGDSIDWNTGKRRFNDKRHYKNWLRLLADENGFDRQYFLDRTDELRLEGYFHLDKHTGGYTLTRMIPL